jgi:hypothetical protein
VGEKLPPKPKLPDPKPADIRPETAPLPSLNKKGIEISNNMVIVRVLIVYGILVAKDMLIALMPCHVNPRFLPIKNNIASSHLC